MKKNLEIYTIDITTNQQLLFADEGIRAGFPSPAQDYMELAIDLNKELIYIMLIGCLMLLDDT